MTDITKWSMERRDEAVRLRLAVKRRLAAVGVIEDQGEPFIRNQNGIASLYLMELFGYKTYNELCVASIEDPVFINTLKMLSGEHALTIIKMLEARKGLN